MKFLVVSSLAAISLLVLQPVYGEESEQRIGSLESKVSTLESRLNSIGSRLSSLETRMDGWLNHIDLALPFLFGVVAAIWAQNTRRNAVLWFLFGLLLGPIAMVVLLIKNRRRRAAAVNPQSMSRIDEEPPGNTPLTRQKVPDPLAPTPLPSENQEA